jgi:hypothetical protein
MLEQARGQGTWNPDKNIAKIGARGNAQLAQIQGTPICSAVTSNYSWSNACKEAQWLLM